MPESQPKWMRTVQVVGWLLLIAAVLIPPPILLWTSHRIGQESRPAEPTSRDANDANGGVETSSTEDLKDKAIVHIGDATLRLDVADTAHERSFGLQGRRSLKDGEGMLFVYDAPRNVEFARKTVPFPLDVIFVAGDGRIIAISLIDSTHDRAASGGQITHVIEVPGGWSARNGVRVGDTVAFLSR